MCPLDIKIGLPLVVVVTLLLTLRDNVKKIAVIVDNSRMPLLMHVIVLMGYLDLSDDDPRFLSSVQEKLNRFQAIIV